MEERKCLTYRRNGSYPLRVDVPNKARTNLVIIPDKKKDGVGLGEKYA